MFHRAIELPASPTETFFLWGPRQTGKTWLLRARYPEARFIDLLRSDEFARYGQRPYLLREELAAAGTRQLVIIDEIQKLPALLDEVHTIIESSRHVFGLCGSSARKVRRGHANLLGGRAVRYQLHGLVSAELGGDFDLVRILNHGTLPRHFASPSPRRLLRSYVADYLKEEIAAEGLVRNLPAFGAFLEVAALSDAELVSYATIARDTGVSNNTIKEYFQILVDTLLGRFLPAYTKRPKRRVIQAPKFYFSDVGVVGVLAKRGAVEPGSELFGKAFENWVFHELSAYHDYRDRDESLAYWRLAGGTEVDFIVGNMALAIEAKATARVTSDHLKGLRSVIEDHPKVRRRVVVCLEPRARRTEDGIDLLPVREFTRRLWAGGLHP